MKTPQFADFDMTKHPMVMATSELAKSYAAAVQANVTESVAFAERMAKAVPSSELVKSATAEMAALNAQALQRLSDVNENAVALFKKHAAELSSKVEELKSKVTGK